MKYFSVDQIGEEYVECECDDGKVHYFKMKDVPTDIKEGDILKFDRDNKLIKDIEKTKERKTDIKNIYNKLII